MSALTLVLKELDINEEEFPELRSYHSRASDDYEQLRRPASPTCSDTSSGTSTWHGTSISSKEEKARVRNENNNNRRKKTPIKKSVSVIREEDVIEGVIMHGGRNILDFAEYTKPLNWQLQSPRPTYINELSYTHQRPPLDKSLMNFEDKSYHMTKCHNCDFLYVTASIFKYERSIRT